jgi:hypothetical protein
MSPSKCNFLHFTKATNPAESLPDFKLFNEILPQVSSVKFLGITFDTRLNFIEHITQLRQKCFSRLNIIKILASKEWALSVETLCLVYKSLIRSIIEYSALISSVISETNFKSINAIQNTVLRLIYKLPRDSASEEISAIAQTPTLRERLDTLNMNYLMSCIHNENELVKDAFNEYKRARSRPAKYISTLGKYYEAVKNETEVYTDFFD